jgi:endonuclease G
MSRLDRLKEARRAAERAALARYIERTPERERTKAIIAAEGPGAADSPQRQMRYQTRQAGLAQARAMSRAGLLPAALERKIGPTLDYVAFAPSEAAGKAGRPVARIVDTVRPGFLPQGFATGFLIRPRLLLTNHHVFPTRGDAVGTGANFLFEQTERGLQTGVVFEIDPDTFYVSDAALDFAVVAVKAGPGGSPSLDDLGFLPLVEATPKILKGQPVNVIQYPEGGPKQYAISQNRLIDILDKEGFVQYETDTLGGSSGSPAFSESWELVALHHASIPETRDGRVIATDGSFWTEEMGDDRVHWIANEGTRVSSIVGRLVAMTLSNPDQQAILRELLASTTDPVDDIAQQMPGGVAPEVKARPGLEGGGMANNQLTFTGPVTIYIQAPGAPAVAAVPPVIAPDRGAIPPTAPEASIRFDPDYRHREGYDPAFLDPDGDIRVPVPTIADERSGEILMDRHGDPLVLKYHHFELVMNEARRLQMWSAVNVDYDPARKSQGNRDSFGSDKWIPDKRIPAAAQIFDADFYKPAGNIDRGHIVRREDNAWGDSDSEIEFANSDTFHWTNCTPQHEAFNQSNPGQNDPAYRGMHGLWGDFENYIQKSRKGNDTRCCILAGPVLDPEDPSADFGEGAIQYPLLFWKVVCVAEPVEGGAEGERELKVFGFLLSQKPVVDRFGIEAFGPGRFKRYQVPLTAITERTGVVFDPVLLAADTLRGETEALPISSLEQVRGLGPSAGTLS